MFVATGGWTLLRLCVAHHFTVWRIFAPPSPLFFPLLHKPQNPLELVDLDTTVDTALTQDAEIIFNAGAHWQTVKMRYEDYACLVHPRIAKFAEHV
jgi:hypothetical protein